MADEDAEGRAVELIKQEEAALRECSVPNLTTRQLLAAARLYLLHEFAKEPPVSDFDADFFERVMVNLCSNHPFLQSVLRGEDLRWFRDDDDIWPNIEEGPGVRKK